MGYLKYQLEKKIDKVYLHSFWKSKNVPLNCLKKVVWSTNIIKNNAALWLKIAQNI
jgi:hypothetical protein